MNVNGATRQGLTMDISVYCNSATYLIGDLHRRRKEQCVFRVVINRVFANLLWKVSYFVTFNGIFASMALGRIFPLSAMFSRLSAVSTLLCFTTRISIFLERKISHLEIFSRVSAMKRH